MFEPVGVRVGGGGTHPHATMYVTHSCVVLMLTSRLSVGGAGGGVIMYLAGVNAVSNVSLDLASVALANNTASKVVRLSEQHHQRGHRTICFQKYESSARLGRIVRACVSWLWRCCSGGEGAGLYLSVSGPVVDSVSMALTDVNATSNSAGESPICWGFLPLACSQVQGDGKSVFVVIVLNEA